MRKEGKKRIAIIGGVFALLVAVVLFGNLMVFTESHTYNFIVYNRVGEPVIGEWEVQAEIYTGDGENRTLIEAKTCMVDTEGKCSIEIGGDFPEGVWLFVYAIKGEYRTAAYSAQLPCLHHDTINLWQEVDCTHPTPNHISGRELLLFWDGNKDGVLSNDEVRKAMQAYWGWLEEHLVQSEYNFIVECYHDFSGDIDAMCPPAAQPAFIAISQVDVSLDGGVTWSPITDGVQIADVYIGDTLALQVTIRNIGGMASDFSIHLFHHNNGYTTTKIFEGTIQGEESITFTKSPAIQSIQSDASYEIKSCSGKHWDLSKQQDSFSFSVTTKPKRIPGFEVFFGIVGLLTVGYIVKREKKEE